jgi:hypothetical protein
MATPDHTADAARNSTTSSDANSSGRRGDPRDRRDAVHVLRRRKEFGELKSDQRKRLKDLEKKNERLRKAVSDLTLEKLILREAASGNF